LAVQRDGVLDRGRDAFGLEARGNLVAAAAGDAQRVLRPDRGQAGRYLGHDRHVAEAFGVAARRAVARRDLVRKDLELLDQDRGLDGVEARGEPDADIVVFVAALAVDAQAEQRFGQGVVVGEDRTTVAVTAERLGGKEAGGGGVAEGAERTALMAGAEGLRGVV